MEYTNDDLADLRASSRLIAFLHVWLRENPRPRDED